MMTTTTMAIEQFIYFCLFSDEDSGVPSVDYDERMETILGLVLVIAPTLMMMMRFRLLLVMVMAPMSIMLRKMVLMSMVIVTKKRM